MECTDGVLPRIHYFAHKRFIRFLLLEAWPVFDAEPAEAIAGGRGYSV